LLIELWVRSDQELECFRQN